MRAFGVKHKNNEIRARSRSGGAFTAISDYVLEKNGVVYGCKMQNNEIAVHWKAESKSDRDKFCGSKYIQSDLLYFGKHIFEDVIYELDKGRWVVFSGTPCQVKGLHNLLEIKKIKTDRLILVDIACHGVCSPEIWKKYLQWITKKYHSNILNIEFRDKKKFGWAAHWETIECKDFFVHSKLFRELFYRHYILRPSCYSCCCKKMPYSSDFTLADFWGCKELYGSFDDNLGVSLVFTNSEKGEGIFSEIRNCMQIVECNIEKVLQPTLISSVDCPEDRSEFWKCYRKEGIEKAINIFAGRSKKKRILELLPNIFAQKLRKEKCMIKVKK